MPMANLSPTGVRRQDALYDNKLCAEAESAGGREALVWRMEAIGYEIVTDRGDIREDGPIDLDDSTGDVVFVGCRAGAACPA